MNQHNEPFQGVWGLDIGGANLKMAWCPFNSNTAATQVHASAFPMWQEHQNLGRVLHELATNMRAPLCDSAVALTMTGELADCFATRAEGVSSILQAVESAFPTQQISVYSVTGQWLSPSEAKTDPWDVAASNWHATASWIASLQPDREMLLVDIGSTTCDIIPVRRGKVASSARTDRDRLERQQLVYTGYERTPVAAIVREFPLSRGRCPVMAERFADSLDAYTILGLIDEEPQNCDTADGRPRTKTHAMARLARMIGEDADRLTLQELQDMACRVVAVQADKVAQGIETNANLDNHPPIEEIIFVGHALGLELAVRERLLQNNGSWRFHKLVEVLSMETDSEQDLGLRHISRSAPAVAVANLWASSEGRKLERRRCEC